MEEGYEVKTLGQKMIGNPWRVLFIFTLAVFLGILLFYPNPKSKEEPLEESSLPLTPLVSIKKVEPAEAAVVTDEADKAVSPKVEEKKEVKKSTSLLPRKKKGKKKAKCPGLDACVNVALAELKNGEYGKMVNSGLLTDADLFGEAHKLCRTKGCK